MILVLAGIPIGVWVFGGLIALVGLGAAAVVVFVFVAALFSTEHADAPEAVAEADLEFPLPPELATLRSQGMDLRYTGFRRDPPFDSQIALLTNADGTILMVLTQSKAMTNPSFLSLLPIGRWLLTTKTSGVRQPPNSKVDIDDFGDGTMAEILEYHQLRLRQTAQQPVSLVLSDIRSAAEGYWRQWLQGFVDAGWARWKSNTTCKFTVRGCAVQAVHTLGMLHAAFRSLERAKRIRQQMAEFGKDMPSASLPAVGDPVPAASQLSAIGAFVVRRTQPDGKFSYMEYSQDGSTYMPIFAERQTAEAYARPFPCQPGESRQIDQVSLDWLRACCGRGYKLVLNAHLPSRSLISPTEFATASVPPAAVRL